MDNLCNDITNAAEDNLMLPYSLMCDAWDSLSRSFQSVADPEMVRRTAEFRADFLESLKTAIAIYQANPINYRFNPKAL